MSTEGNKGTGECPAGEVVWFDWRSFSATSIREIYWSAIKKGAERVGRQYCEPFFSQHLSGHSGDCVAAWQRGRRCLRPPDQSYSAGPVPE